MHIFCLNHQKKNVYWGHRFQFLWCNFSGILCHFLVSGKYFQDIFYSFPLWHWSQIILSNIFPIYSIIRIFPPSPWEAYCRNVESCIFWKHVTEKNAVFSVRIRSCHVCRFARSLLRENSSMHFSYIICICFARDLRNKWGNSRLL